MKKKIILSYLSIAVLLAAFLLLPRQKDTTKKYLDDLKPITAKRYVPAPTATANSNKAKLILNSQTPGASLVIKTVDFGDGGYILIKNNDEEIGRSEINDGIKNNLTITLMKETTDGESIKVVLYDEQNNLITEKDVLITTTALSPSIILPKDLE